MVILSGLTTTTGDGGSTRLADGSRVAKTDPLIGALGAIAEANAAIGLARAGGLAPELDAWARRIQQELFDLGADLAMPLPAGPQAQAGTDEPGPEPQPGTGQPGPEPQPGPGPQAQPGADDPAPAARPAAPAAERTRPGPGPRRVGAEAVRAWEQVVRELVERLGPLRSFVLPGGPPPAAALHLATTITRRAERAAWRAAATRGKDQPGGVNGWALVYLNRISDVLFALARAAADGAETLWEEPARRTPR
ncbi:MAG: ATP:cob(I)alamin adenosyltransferase [Bifidobacteriaceae bacterium]|jgi:cob(I)alamin adenosyltransferase|nr:ATP:cob(I)alamin adenosyltransferase [Bifidobacteriaceae bacterium]